MKRGMGGRGGEEGENEAVADESETRTPDAGRSQLGLRSPVTTSSAPASAGRRQPALPLTRTCAHTPLAPISRQLLESGPSAPVPHALLRALALARATSAPLPAFPSRHSA